MTNKPYPVLKSVSQNVYPVSMCGHEDCEHMSIRRLTSVENPGMYWAIEYERCRICNVVIRKVWYTPYKDYAEGIAAYVGTSEAKVDALLRLIYELLELIDHLAVTPPIIGSEFEEPVMASIERMKNKAKEYIDDSSADPA